MIKHPIGNKVFITLPNALQEKIKTESGLELFIDGSYNHEDWSTVEGVVHSVGRRKKGSPKKTYNKHTPRPKTYRGQGK